MIYKIIAAAAIISILASAGLAQNCTDYKKNDVSVQLDSTGISGWRFLNPRAPFPVIEYTGKTEPNPLDWIGCAMTATVAFFNSASGEAIAISIPYTYRRFDLRRLADVITDQTALVNELKGQVSNGLKTSLQSEFDSSRANGMGITDLVASDIGEKLLKPKKERGDISPDLYRVVSLVSSAQKKVAQSISGTPTTAPDTSKEAAQLNDALIRLGSFLQEAINAIESEKNPPPLSECSDPTAETQTCMLKFTIFDNGTFIIPTATWERLVRFSDGVVRFKVNFFDDQIPVSNSEGYLKVRPTVLERPSSTTWSVTASAGYSVVAQSDRKRQDGTTSRPFTLEDPYTGKTLDSFNGTGRLELIQTLQERARARIDPQFKSGALGGNEKTTTFSVPLYTIDVFGVNGTSGRFGNYTMLNPSRGIAINASGEGFQFNWHGVMIGHIIKSESAKQVPDPENKDTSMTLLRVSGAPGFSIFKHVDLFGVYGEKRDTEKTSPYDHYTWGGQLFFADSPGQPEKQSIFSSLSGSVSYYHSARDIRPQSTPGTVLTDGSGNVWLLDSGLTWLRENGADTKALRSLSILLGGGTGDNPDSKHRDESYLGETATFSGFDSLFLGSSFLGNLQDGSPARTPFGTGLANKFYLGLSYTEREFKQINPLWWIARVAQVAGDAKATATTFKVHWFHLDEPFQNRRDAGFEAGLQWQIEVPAGVKNSLGCSRYFPGSATRRFFLVDPVQCSLQVSLVLQ